MQQQVNIERTLRVPWGEKLIIVFKEASKAENI